jgi:hypothetical protein
MWNNKQAMKGNLKEIIVDYPKYIGSIKQI